MPFDLISFDKECDFSTNFSYWRYILFELGCCRAIGAVKKTEKTYLYIPDDNGFAPMNNDGFFVNKAAAIEMASIASKAINHPLLQGNDNFKLAVERFIEFCYNCNGFNIY